MFDRVYIVVVLQLCLWAQVTLASGYFELQLLRIQNYRGELYDGNCCGGFRSSDGVCTQECRTYFSVCLKEFQSSVTPNGPCTFGNNSSAVLGGNSFAFPYEYPWTKLSLNFTFAWTKSYTLILEAWDHNNQTSPGKDSLIDHATRTGIILPSQVWSTFTHEGRVAQFAYRIRVMCEEHYYNTTCNKFCRPRDNRFGHYRCDENGESICLDGWMGANCEQAICRKGCHAVQGFCEKPEECRCRHGWQGDHCDQCVPYPGCKHGSCNGTPFTCQCDKNWGGMLCEKDLDFCGTHHPCRNSATCHNTAPNDYSCECPYGFSGVNCEIVENRCAAEPCQNGGTCAEITGGHLCSCTLGWIGTNCEINIDDCVSAPCLHGGTCVDLVNAYQCLCPPEWEGNSCQLDANECVGSPCINAFSCKNLVGNYTCDCRPGWTGKNCNENINDCPGFCHNGATCIDLVNDYHCACLPGFTGRDCQTNINECASDPCQNGGQCYDLIASFQCICPPGFTGTQCQVDIDLCQPNPCKNGATCYNTPSGEYYCHCPEEFQGLNCSETRTNCTTPPCEVVDSCTVRVASSNDSSPTNRLLPSSVCGDHGLCISSPGGGYSCVCDPGFTGKYCHENINDCQLNICQNSGTCVDGINSLQCICKEGWQGAYCSINTNDCEPSPCRNNGTCTDQVADFICKCQPGWKGKTCNLKNSHCDTKTCRNGGSCIDTGDTFVCKCLSGWEGTTCHLAKEHSCASNPCMNGATCVNSGDNFSCICKDGFDGPTCRQNINDCNPFPCYNGGRCKDGVNWFMCECANGFTGPDCRININECGPSPCAYGSTCIDGIGEFKCICPPGRTGDRCQIVLGVQAVQQLCYWDQRWYPSNSSWQHLCNTCICKNGKVTCSKMWCGPRNCLHHPNLTEPTIECETDEVCVTLTKETCLTPPCLPWGQCHTNMGASPALPEVPQSCFPNQPDIEDREDCGRMTLVFDKTKLPKGISVENVCSYLRKMPVLHTVARLGTMVILCGLKQDQEETLEVTMFFMDSDSIKEVRALISEAVNKMADIISRKLTNSSTLAAVVDVKIETGMSVMESKKGSHFVWLVGILLGLALILALAALYLWHSRRRKRCLSGLKKQAKFESLNTDEKSNNQNEENLRRYHNPLNVKEQITVSSDTELIEMDADEKECNISSRLYKAEPSEVKKNTSYTHKDCQKNMNLKLPLQRTLSDREVIV
uniref:Delta-like protein n=1 Tax=Euperipatoides kanangrensis TaxID=488523 RepID=A0A0U5JE14_9BILA|nr:Serrate [Euperipatoides kanangrensis]